ncbi:hypothetical protein [Enterocloster sp.]|uniref:hypothetical protein n=1 Tax=Enterocloster sp. TaxID=2719315 RepID=UPI0039A3BBDB
MIESLASYPLLNGYRGGAVCDKEALVNLLVKISEMAAEGQGQGKRAGHQPCIHHGGRGSHRRCIVGYV